MPTVIYLMGHPYSGSTLLSVALGNSRQIINLGEVSFLENDYRAETRCLCGHSLAECEFWQKLKASLDERQAHLHPSSRFQLEHNGVLSGPDIRHKSLLFNLKLLFNAGNAFPEAELENYSRKNERFFQVVSEVFDCPLMVDDAKSPQRLTILMTRTNLNFKVIWLQRGMKGLYASRIKREKIRNRSYTSFFFPILSIGWLLYHYWACVRLFVRLSNEQKCIVRYEDFVDNPSGVQDRLSEFLDADLDFNIHPGNLMKIRDQHVYVGNRWLFKKTDLKEVQIRAAGHRESAGKLEETIYRIFSILFPVLQS